MRKSPVSRYGFINAKLRTKISTILLDEFREKLLRAASLEEVFHYLRESEFSPLSAVYHKTGDLQAVEAELFEKQIGQYQDVVKHTEGEVRDFVTAMTIKLEIENLKNLLRLWYGSRIKKRPMDHRVGYIYKEKILHAIPWDTLINADSLEKIAAALDQSPYQALLAPFLGTSVAQNGIFYLETALDRFYYRYLKEQSEKLPSGDRKIVHKIMTAEIDLQNLSWIIRYSRFYQITVENLTEVLMPGGSTFSPEQIAPLFAGAHERTGSGEMHPGISGAAGLLAQRYPGLQALADGQSGGSASSEAAYFEQLLAQIRKKEFVKIITGYPFTIGIVLVYFFLRNRESRFLTGVFNGKYYGWDSQRIREFSE